MNDPAKLTYLWLHTCENETIAGRAILNTLAGKNTGPGCALTDISTCSKKMLYTDDGVLDPGWTRTTSYWSFDFGVIGLCAGDRYTVSVTAPANRGMPILSDTQPWYPNDGVDT